MITFAFSKHFILQISMKKETSDIPQEAVRSAIRQYMESHGLTQVWLASRLGYKTRQSVYNYMSNVNFTAGVLKKWSEVLNYPYELLVDGIPYDTQDEQTIGDRLKAMEERIHQLEQEVRILKG